MSASSGWLMANATLFEILVRNDVAGALDAHAITWLDRGAIELRT